MKVLLFQRSFSEAESVLCKVSVITIFVKIARLIYAGQTRNALFRRFFYYITTLLKKITAKFFLFQETNIFVSVEMKIQLCILLVYKIWTKIKEAFFKIVELPKCIYQNWLNLGVVILIQFSRFFNE